MASINSLNFEIKKAGEGLIPVMDRGFLYGDSIYEVVRTYGGRHLFLLDRHYERLLRSADQIRLKVPFGLEKLEDHIQKCLDRVDYGDSYIRVIVSRGVDARFDLHPEADLEPVTVVLIDAAPVYPRSHYDDGISVAMVSVRRNLKSALDPNIKSGNYLNNVLALIEAKSRGAHDALMLNHEECVTEATTSNLFLVKGGKVVTPEMDSGILEGISRGLLKEVMSREKILYVEKRVPIGEFLQADEAFLTSTLKEVMPITSVDGKPLGTGKPGPVTCRLHELFRKEVEKRLT